MRQVELRGTATNYFGIGAVVRVQADPLGPQQMRLVAANSNFMGQNELVAHFGLGSEASSVDSVRVEWPVSGLVQYLHDVAANQRITIQEPQVGDYDGDGNIEAIDHQILLTCLSGPQGGISGNLYARGANLRDFSMLQAGYMGSQ